MLTLPGSTFSESLIKIHNLSFQKMHENAIGFNMLRINSTVTPIVIPQYEIPLFLGIIHPPATPFHVKWTCVERAIAVPNPINCQRTCNSRPRMAISRGSTVECYHNGVKYKTILHTSLQWLRQNIYQNFNLQTTPISRPSGRAIGCLLWRFRRKLTTL